MIPDPYVAALRTMRPFTVYEIGPNDELTVWMHVEGANIIDAVVIDVHNPGPQAERVGAEIAFWTRVSSQCDRVVQVCERNYAVWKSMFRITKAREMAEAGEKKPTQAQLEDLYRIDPGYAAINRALEEAKEAAASAQGIVAAFKAKREMLGRELFRANDGSLRSIA